MAPLGRLLGARGAPPAHTLLVAYLQARRIRRTLTPELRRAYWFASASRFGLIAATVGAEDG
jgi:hypothetical protein